MGTSAFTVKNEKIVNRLTNKVTVQCSKEEMVVDALWDTGATTSCISRDVVENLRLIPTGKTDMRTPSGQDTRNTYLVNILLPNGVTFLNCMVVDTEIGDQGIGMLIGMDIICTGDFAVSSFNKKTVFSFRNPSKTTTDYVIEARKEAVIGEKHGRGKSKKRKKKKK